MFKETLSSKLTRWVAGFFGSWFSVFLHTVWMVLWFVLGGGVYWLTLLLSVEAIYIGIFILMTQNWERQQDLMETRRERERQKRQLDRDIHLDKSTVDTLDRIERDLRGIKEALKS